MRRFLALCLASLLLISIYQPLKSHSESLTVSMQVGATQVVFSGYTSPSSFVVIKEDSIVVATTTADSSGNWSSTVNVAIPDIHNYTIYSTDLQSQTSASVEYSLNVSGNTTTTIDHIVLPPTLNLSGSTLSGLTYPASQITILVSTGPSYSLTADSNGAWSYDLSSLLGGPHTINVTTTVTSTYVSVASTAITYTAPSASPSPTPAPSSSTSPTSLSSASPTISPTPRAMPSTSPAPFFIAIYDLNHDGKLGKSELIEIIKSWLQKLLVCDLNHDKKCNLIDLSILLYYIER